MGVLNMRKAIMIAGLILTLGVLAPAGALGKAGNSARPIKAHASGTTVFDIPTLTFVSDTTKVMRTWAGQGPLRRGADPDRAERL